MKFEEMNKEERQEYINGLYDELNDFILQMAIDTNTVDKFNSISEDEYPEYAEGMAEQLGKTEELLDMIEYIDTLDSIKDRL